MIALLLVVLVGCDPISGRSLPSPHEDTAAPVPGDSGDTGNTSDTGIPTDTPTGPALYGSDRIHSPVTPWVADTWRRWLTGAGQPDVFLKAGASSTVSANTLYCFADPEDTDLGDHAALADALAFFRDGDAAGSTPFDRDTEAARSGMSAGWVISGSPSPLEEEIDAIDPRYAVIHYGTNDMGMGSTYSSAMPGFYQNMTALLDILEGRGILPVLTGISPRGDSTAADEWAETYNAIIRGLAQARQVPFVDLHLATVGLEGQGLASDGLHLEAYSGGACVLTEDGLEHGYNVRNLIVLEALDRVWSIIEDAQPHLDEDVDILAGEGSLTAPLRIPALPFTDSRNTADSPHAVLDEYTGCEYDADESGPEWVYTLTLDEPTALRAIVLDGDGVDIDVHLLDASGTEEGCIVRADRAIETTVPAGTWHIVLDTYVSGGTPQPGEYLFVLQPCEPEDSDCL